MMLYKPVMAYYPWEVFFTLKLAAKRINFLGFFEKLRNCAAIFKPKKGSHQSLALGNLVEHHQLDRK